MNYNQWHKSYQQEKEREEQNKDRRNFVYSFGVTACLFALAIGVSYLAPHNINKKMLQYNSDYTNRLERVIR